MSEERVERRLAAILAADVAGVYQISRGVLVMVVPVAVNRALGRTANADVAVGAFWSVSGVAASLGALVSGNALLIGRGQQVIVFCSAAIAVAIFPLSASFGPLGLAAGPTIMDFLEGLADVALLTLRQSPNGLVGFSPFRCASTYRGVASGSLIGGWLVTYSLDIALIVAAMASLTAAVGAFFLISAAGDSSHSRGGMPW